MDTRKIVKRYEKTKAYNREYAKKNLKGFTFKLSLKDDSELIDYLTDKTIVPNFTQFIREAITFYRDNH